MASKNKYVVEIVIETDETISKKNFEGMLERYLEKMQMGVSPSTSPILPKKVRVRAIDTA